MFGYKTHVGFQSMSFFPPHGTSKLPFSLQSQSCAAVSQGLTVPDMTWPLCIITSTQHLHATTPPPRWNASILEPNGPWLWDQVPYIETPVTLLVSYLYLLDLIVDVFDGVPIDVITRIHLFLRDSLCSDHWNTKTQSKLVDRYTSSAGSNSSKLSTKAATECLILHPSPTGKTWSYSSLNFQGTIYAACCKQHSALLFSHCLLLCGAHLTIIKRAWKCPLILFQSKDLFHL